MMDYVDTAQKAFVAQKKRHWADAVAGYDAILDFTNSSQNLDTAEKSSLFYQRSFCRAQLGAVCESLNDAESALLLTPQNASARLLRGIARDQLGMNTLATQDFEYVAAIATDSADALCMLAISLHRRCLYASALACCERALALEACHVLSLIVRGDTLKRLPGTSSELSTADFALALDLGGERAQRLIGKGFTFARLNEYCSAVIDWLPSLVCPLYLRTPDPTESHTPEVPPAPPPLLRLDLTAENAEVLNRIAIFSENAAPDATPRTARSYQRQWAQQSPQLARSQVIIANLNSPTPTWSPARDYARPWVTSPSRAAASASAAALSAVLATPRAAAAEQTPPPPPPPRPATVPAHSPSLRRFKLVSPTRAQSLQRSASDVQSPRQGGSPRAFLRRPAADSPVQSSPRAGMTRPPPPPPPPRPQPSPSAAAALSESEDQL